MALSWMPLLLAALLTCDAGVSARAAPTRGLLSGFSEREAHGAALRAVPPRDRDREREPERCAELAAPWREQDARVSPHDATLLRLRVLPLAAAGAARGSVFPGRPLFSFVRRVYSCCQDGVGCRSVRGLPGRRRGESDVDFLLTSEASSLQAVRAELHLQLSNPQQLEVGAALPWMAKRKLSTRFSSRSRGHTLELRVDLLLLFQSLQEVAAAEQRRRPEPGAAAVAAWSELGLLLSCSHGGAVLACRAGGVHLLHTPFIALYY